MARTNFLRPLTAVFLFAVVPVAAACNGHVVSLGSTGDTIQPVTASQAANAATASSAPAITCANGWAHPNICCSAGPGVAASCGAWEQNPFHACEAGSTTYPNLLSCCDLADPRKCVDTSPPTTGPTPPPPPPPSYGCGFACPPGWWPQAPGAVSPGGVEGAMCCTDYGTGTQCVAQGGGPIAVVTNCGYGGASGSSSGASSSGGTTSGGGNGGSGGGPTPVDAGVPVPIPADAAVPPTEDAGPAPGDDAGILPGDDGGCGGGWVPPADYDGGTASLCNACPAGWTEDPIQPELCCQALADGTRLCFSQATGSATSTGSIDGGTTSTPPNGGTGPTTGWGSGGAGSPDGAPGVSCSGSDSTCGCTNTVNGHTYKLDCSAANSTPSFLCNCLVDDTSTGTTSVGSCQDSTAVQNAYSASSGCGFP